jgi:hypothetical protein
LLVRGDLQLPVFRAEETGAVQDEDTQHSDNPQPINVVPSLLHGIASFY